MAVYMSAARQRRRTIAIAVATLLFGLIAGLVIGFATLYMAVAPESSDLAAAYKPLGRVPGRGRADTRSRTPSACHCRAWSR